LVAAVYGKRFCDDCGYESDDCCCGDVAGYDSYGHGCDCDSCHGGGVPVESAVPGDGIMPDAATIHQSQGLSHRTHASAPVQMARQQQTSRNRMVAQGQPQPLPNMQTAPAPPKFVREANRLASPALSEPAAFRR
jgi:hypothetical protein